MAAPTAPAATPPVSEPDTQQFLTRAQVKAARLAEQENTRRERGTRARPAKRAGDAVPDPGTRAAARRRDSGAELTLSGGPTPTGLLSAVPPAPTDLPSAVPPAPTDLPSAMPPGGPITPRRVAQRRLAEAEQGARGHRRLTAAAAVAAVGLVGAGAAVARSTPSEASTAASADLANPGLIVTKAVDRQSVEASGTPAAGLARAAAGLPGSDRSTFRMKAVSRSRTRTPVTSSSAPTSGCSGVRPSAHFSNGQIPVSSLCALPFAEGHMLRADAAVQIIRLNAAYRAKFGVDIGMTDSYRSLSAQFNLAARKPGLAARPGTSEHGWGLAVDLSEGPDQVNSVRRAWFLLNAPRFGWDNPAWARPGGSKPEPWHWEFVRGV